MEKKKPFSEHRIFSKGLALAFWLAALTSFFLYKELVAPLAFERICYEKDVLIGQTVSPYLYRPLWPWLSQTFSHLTSFTGWSPILQHKIFHGLWNTVVLTWMYFGVFSFFSLWCTKAKSMVGVLILQVLIPLSISGYYMEENFFLLGGVAWMLRAFFLQQWLWLYLGMFILSLHREQSVMIPIWIVLSIFTLTAQNKKLIIAKTLGLFLIWMAVFFGIRWIRGVHYSPYNIDFHLTYNLDVYHFTHYITPLWLGQVIIPAVLVATQWKKLTPPFHYWLLSLLPYYLLFMFFGKWTELDKALSGYLFMIPAILTWIEPKKV